MKQKNFSILVWAIVIMLLQSCSKGGTSFDDGSGGPPHVETPNDIIAPEITIATPVTNQVFSNGNVISITGKITDDYGLYRGTIRVTNDATGMIVMNQAYEIHGLVLYNFTINHTAAVTGTTDYTVTVSFEDHGLNTTTKSVKVKVNP
ncbi:MAG: hypothetical protein H7Y01_03205 [Ferruginibacter sp.]|nr:hypothetical protein [Chitinophagaceae bacterium]